MGAPMFHPATGTYKLVLAGEREVELSRRA